MEQRENINTKERMSPEMGLYLVVWQAHISCPSLLLLVHLPRREQDIIR